MKIFLSKKIEFFAFLSLLQIFSFQSFAQDFSSNNLATEIEKTLLFDEDSRKKIDFYQKKKSAKKDDFIISSGSQKNEESSDENSLDILVVDPKPGVYDLRRKEKTAYNFFLIDQYEAAVELYKQVLAAEPNNGYAKFSLAVIYQNLGQYSQAKKLYRELLKDEADNKNEIIGNILNIMIDESPREAIYMLSRLTAQNPKSSYIFAQAAMAYEKIGKHEEAISLLGKAVNLDSKQLEYKYNLAVIYDKTNKKEKALEFYNQVVSDYSDDSASISLDEVKKRIESIKNKL